MSGSLSSIVGHIFADGIYIEYVFISKMKKIETQKNVKLLSTIYISVEHEPNPNILNEFEEFC